MAEELKTEKNRGQQISDSLKNWVMVALTAIFVLIYVAAILGKIEPLKDASIIARVEPIIFVIIGYYFGRLPAQATEKTLNNEINRQTQKADAAQNIKEKAQQEREVLEEKIRNVKITLSDQNPGTLSARTKGVTDSTDAGPNKNQAVETALRILDS